MIEVNVIAQCKRCNLRYKYKSGEFNGKQDFAYQALIKDMKNPKSILHQCDGPYSPQYGIAEIIGMDVFLREDD